MRRFAAIIAATVFIIGAPIMGASVGAAPMVGPGAIRDAADNLNMVERTQFIWLGRHYCWYDDGWNGPGWYWCGQYLTSGIGWGGGYGWHHWHGGHPGGGHGTHGGHAHATVVHAGHAHAAVVHAGHARAAVSPGGGGGHARAAVSHGGGGGGHGGGGGGGHGGGGGGGHGGGGGGGHGGGGGGGGHGGKH